MKTDISPDDRWLEDEISFQNGLVSGDIRSLSGRYVNLRRIFAMTKRPVEPPDAAERRKAKAVIAYRVDLLPKFDATGRSSAMEDGPLRMWLEPGGCLPSYYNIKSNPDLGDQR